MGEDLLGGFAILGYPAEYGSSGIMTFITNHDGDVFQKDLGEGTAAAAERMAVFNPNGSVGPGSSRRAPRSSVPRARAAGTPPAGRSPDGSGRGRSPLPGGSSFPQPVRHPYNRPASLAPG